MSLSMNYVVSLLSNKTELFIFQRD